MGRQKLRGRSIFIVNDPATARDVMIDRVERFPKASLFSEVLAPLVGGGAFVANGEPWRRRRESIKPAFTHIALQAAFPHIIASADAACARIDDLADTHRTFDLDAEMSHAAADVIFRTMFSEPIDTTAAQDVYQAFARFAFVQPRSALRPRGKSALSAQQALARRRPAQRGV